MVPHLSHTSPYTPIILTIALVTILILIPIVSLLPMRVTVLIFGLAPFLLTHPFTKNAILSVALFSSHPYLKHIRTRITRYIDNDRLEDKHWNTEMREVELWENERWLAKPVGGGDDNAQHNGGWNKANLKLGERRPWTRGRDGWSAIAEDGSGDVRSGFVPLLCSWEFKVADVWFLWVFPTFAIVAT